MEPATNEEEIPDPFPMVSIEDLDETDSLPSDASVIQKMRKAACPVRCGDPQQYFTPLAVIYASDTSSVNDTYTKEGNYRVVVKKIRKRNDPTLQSYVDLEVALSVLSGVSPYVVDFYSVFATSTEVWLAMEMMNPGSLARLRSVFAYTESHIAYILKQVLHGLLYLHRRGRVHRDIKADNILINEQGEIKLTDFGWATQLTQEHPVTRVGVGSIFWMAPEVHRSETYGREVDIWSLGIFAYELAVGHPPHYELDSDAAAMQICSSSPPTLPPTNPAWSEHLHSFLRDCLQINGKKRPSAEELLNHPLITECTLTQNEWLADLTSHFPDWPSLALGSS